MTGVAVCCVWLCFCLFIVCYTGDTPSFAFSIFLSEQGTPRNNRPSLKSRNLLHDSIFYDFKIKDRLSIVRDLISSFAIKNRLRWCDVCLCCWREFINEIIFVLFKNHANECKVIIIILIVYDCKISCKLLTTFEEMKYTPGIHPIISRNFQISRLSRRGDV